MKNFTYYTPTKVVFGKDTEMQTGKLVKEFGGTKVLLHYGGGSAERSGLLGRIRASLEAEGIPGRRIFDAGLYVWNREAAGLMKSLGADLLTFPYECREQEMAELGFRDKELVIYGRIPLMVSAQCTANTEGECRKKSQAQRARKTGKADSSWMNQVDFRYLTDRRKAVFPEDSHCRFCTSVIYNSVPLWLLDRVPAACEAVRFHFTDEAAGEAARILEKFVTGNTAPEGAFTRGHFMRGVE